jgi:Mn-dependent DtxR family transcriptional regulator
VRSRKITAVEAGGQVVIVTQLGGAITLSQKAMLREFDGWFMVKAQLAERMKCSPRSVANVASRCVRQGLLRYDEDMPTAYYLTDNGEAVRRMLLGKGSFVR